MFSLLKSAGTGPSTLEKIPWKLDFISTNKPHVQEEPSFLDSIAAPTVFLQQALVFETSLDADALRAAIAAVVDQYPSFGHRLTQSEAGELQIRSSDASDGSSGIAFQHAHSDWLTLQQLLQQQQHQEAPNSNSSQQVEVPELTDLLFSHLPGSLTPDYVNSDLALVHIGLLQLQGGGSLLGVRMSHLLGDWTSLRLLLRCFSIAYTNAALSTPKEQQQQQQQLSNLSSAAPLLNQLLTSLKQQQQQQGLGPSWCPVRLKPLEPEDTSRFEKLAALARQGSSSSSSKQAPVRLSNLVPAGRVQQLKQQLLAEAQPAAANTNNGSSGSTNNNAAPKWCSTHNALLASVLAAFGRLPGRQQLPHDVSVAVDMRSRLPPAQQQLLPTQQQQQLSTAVGNFFASAIVEDWRVAEGSSRAELAQALAAAVDRAAGVWLPDLAWASGLDSACTPHSSTQAQQQESQQQGQQQGQQQESQQQQGQQDSPCCGSGGGSVASRVTWRRLHAMGPTAQLQQQMQLGLLASLSTTQWPLDFAHDACCAGQLPSLAVPSFSQPQPYPLVLMQQAAPAAQQGAWLVHLFLDASEVTAMQEAVEAQLGL